MEVEKPPSGEWMLIQIADRLDVDEGRSDKPCYRIYGPDGIEGVCWSWGDKRKALTEWLREYWGHIYPDVITTERYFT